MLSQPLLYLAQVVESESKALQILAWQKLDQTWELAIEPNRFLPLDLASLPVNDQDNLSDRMLVLVEMSENQEIFSIQIATNWVLNLVQTYLTPTLPSPWLKQEIEQAERWRQHLTLQSQELSRRSLELEVRREQIEMLEKKLKQEKQKLTQIAENLASSRLIDELK